MDPYDEFERFNKQMRKLLEGLMGGSRVEIFTPFHGGGLGKEFEGVREPLVDVREEAKELIVTAEVPGVDKKDIKLKIQTDDLGNHVLVITALRGSSSKKKSEEGVFSSIGSLSYRKEVLLPTKVKNKTGKASYKNGILEVKFEKVKQDRKENATDIPIK